MTQKNTTFPCGNITLEGVWHLPEKMPSPAVVVCHPHPLYGGDMSNNVVVAVCQALIRQSIAALRFNFRGVGASTGDFGGGIAEQKDVSAALSFASSTAGIDPQKIGLVGYSFGARVALHTALEDEHVNLLALVSPPLDDLDWGDLKKYRRPKFIILGDADFAVPLERVEKYLTEIPPTQCHTIAGADHFWLGFESEMAHMVAQFFIAGFNLGDGITEH